MILNFGEQNGYKVRSPGCPFLVGWLHTWALRDPLCSLLVSLGIGH